MSISRFIKINSAKHAANAPRLSRVCMHVLKEAREDVRLMRAATVLIEAGYGVSVLDIEVGSSVPDEETLHGVKVQHVRMPTWRTSRRFEFWFFLKAMQVLAVSLLHLLRTPADIYHAQELTALPACFIAAKLRRKPLIFEVYDLQIPVPETAIGFWQRASWLVVKLHALLLPRCAAVVVSSPLHAQELSKRFQMREAVLVRNFPVYQSVPKRDVLRHYLGVSSETCIALFQGTLQADRELDRLVRSAKYLSSNIMIVMMGKSEGTVRDELQSLIENEGVADRVKIIPPVSYEELLDWTASADVGLIIYSPEHSLNIRTHLPNKLFEYLMAGLPVLSSQLDAVAEIISAYDVGSIVSSLEPASIAASINTILADPLSLERMHRNALDAVRRDLCWDKEKQQVLDLYQKILGTPPSTQPQDLSRGKPESKPEPSPLLSESQVQEAY